MSGLAAILLAGGQARRMGGGDKCLRPLGGRPILTHVIERTKPQASPILLNVNGDPERFAAFGLPVRSDIVEGFAGPLAGILTGLTWLQETAPEAEWLLSVATDTPFFPLDLAQKLKEGAQASGHKLACAKSNGRTHPVFGLWHTTLTSDLRQALVEEDIRKIDLWTARHGLAEVEFACTPLDPFFNANRQEDLALAEEMLAG